MQTTKDILKLKKRVSSYSDTLKKLKNAEFKPKSITKNIELAASLHAMFTTEFKAVQEEFNTQQILCVAENKARIVKVQELDHKHLKIQLLEIYLKCALTFITASICGECSKTNRERIYGDKLKNQILLSGIEVLKDRMQVNLPTQEEFFCFEALDLKMRVDGHLLYYYSATLDLVSLLISFNEAHSLTNTCNAIKH